MKLKDIITTTFPGIWGFINKKDKRIFISNSSNVIVSISRNTTELLQKTHSCRQLIKDLPKLELIILETSVPKNQRKARQSYWMDYYINQGYTLYRTIKPVLYKPRLVITEDFFIHVLLVNARNDKVVVGVFNDMDTAQSFVSTHYSSNKIYNIIYAKNNLTMLFYKKQKKEHKIVL